MRRYAQPAAPDGCTLGQRAPRQKSQISDNYPAYVTHRGVTYA